MEWWGNSNFGSLLLYPAYVQDYLDRVTANDVLGGNTQGLERGVTDAFNVVLQELVADTILGVSGGVIAQAASKSKAMPFMCGARTITGCLTPVVGPAPTNFNFTGLDYSRKTGLFGNASTRYLNANRNNTEDPVNRHLAVYQTTPATNDGFVLIGTANVTGRSSIVRITNLSARITASSGSFPTVSQSGSAGFVGGVRTSSESITLRNGGVSITASVPSQTPASAPIGVFANGDGASACNARISYYSIGETLDLAILDARVTTLMNTLAGLTL
jgi:hypothetical protein